MLSSGRSSFCREDLRNSKPLLYIMVGNVFFRTAKYTVCPCAIQDE